MKMFIWLVPERPGNGINRKKNDVAPVQEKPDEDKKWCFFCGNNHFFYLEVVIKVIVNKEVDN